MDAASWIVPIVVALITGGFSFLGVSMTIKAQHNKSMTEMRLENQKQILLIQNEISSLKADVHRLEVKQDKHNSLIERTYKLEEKVGNLEKRM